MKLIKYIYMWIFNLSKHSKEKVYWKLLYYEYHQTANDKLGKILIAHKMTKHFLKKPISIWETRKF